MKCAEYYNKCLNDTQTKKRKYFYTSGRKNNNKIKDT